MRIAVGCDHRGVAVKKHVLQRLGAKGHQALDEGTHDETSIDYPDIAEKVCKAVVDDSADRGILICGTGIGVCIAANKFDGIRAANVHDELSAELSRRHNDANVLCLSADLLGTEMTDRIVDHFLNTEFEGGRHARRLAKIAAFEQHPPE